MIPRADDPWRAEAACGDMDTSLFFPTNDASGWTAKAVCAGCPVREKCLDFAMQTRQEHGVWGGLAEGERRTLRRSRQHAARKARRAAEAGQASEVCPECGATIRGAGAMGVHMAAHRRAPDPAAQRKRAERARAREAVTS